MKFTTIQSNLIILATIMAALQIGIIWILEFNGGDGVIVQALVNKDLDILAAIFSPSTALGIALGKAGTYKKE